MSPNPVEKAAILRIIDSIDARDDDYCAHEFNVYRWLVAYGNEEEEAAKVGLHMLRAEVLLFSGIIA